VEYLQSLLKEIGLEAERVQMFNLSAASAGRFVEITREIVDKVGKMGENSLKKEKAEGGRMKAERNET